MADNQDNPPAAAVPVLAYSAIDRLPEPRWYRPIVLIQFSVSLSSFIGALTGAVNGVVDQGHFIHTIGRQFGHVDDWVDWHEIVLWGAWEGTWLGSLFALAMGLTQLIVTRARLPPRDCLRCSIQIGGLVLVGWLVGGGAGVAKALFWHVITPGPNSDHLAHVMRLGFVPLAIKGLYLAGIIAVVAGPVLLVKWHR